MNNGAIALILGLLMMSLVTPASAQLSASLFGGTDGSAGGSVAWQFDGRQAEAGVHFLSNEVDGDKRISAGPFGALRSDTLLANLIAPETAIPFVGGALPYDFKGDEWMTAWFAGAVFYPGKEISPVAFVEYDWYPWADVSDAGTELSNKEDIVLRFALRVALK